MANLRAGLDAAGDAVPLIPVPVGTFFVREIGLGLGFRYALAGIKDIDAAASPSSLVQLLDRVAAVPADPAQLLAWTPTACCVAYTVGLQAMAKPDGQVAPVAGDGSHNSPATVNASLSDNHMSDKPSLPLSDPGRRERQAAVVFARASLQL